MIWSIRGREDAGEYDRLEDGWCLCGSFINVSQVTCIDIHPSMLFVYLITITDYSTLKITLSHTNC